MSSCGRRIRAQRGLNFDPEVFYRGADPVNESGSSLPQSSPSLNPQAAASPNKGPFTGP